MDPKEKKMLDALIADRMGIKGYELAYTELKNQISDIGQSLQTDRGSDGDRADTRRIHHCRRAKTVETLEQRLQAGED